MPKHYFQVEGVNLYASIYDTSQLSVIRGSSVLLKLAVEALDARPNSPIKTVVERLNATSQIPRFELPDAQKIPLTAISTGASSGIYKADTDQPETLAKAIAEYLSEHRYLRYFTFTIVYTPCQDDFKSAKERLVAKARLQQARQLSIAPHPEVSQAAEPCALQGILPADKRMDKPPKGFTNEKIAPACQDRFLFGRRFRTALYEAEISALLGDEQRQNTAQDKLVTSTVELRKLLNFLQKAQDEGDEERFAKSFNAIADDEAYQNLEHKIAILYFDGNGFGKIQLELVKTVEDQKSFDQQIKSYRREFLAQVLMDFKAASKNGVLCLETLLWGGDEMLFVVPASQGMALLQRFYQRSKHWEIKLGDETRPLTHAGGLVFCHYKTPIARASQLAKDLAEAVKERDYGREGNYFDYMVLESIDYPAEPLAVFFTKRYGLLGVCRYPLQPAREWRKILLPSTLSPAQGGGALPPSPACGRGGGGEGLRPNLMAEQKERGVKAPSSPEHELARERVREEIAALLNAMPKGQAYGIARAALAKSSPCAEAGKPKGQAPAPQEADPFAQLMRRFEQLQAETTLVEDLQTLLWDNVLRPPEATGSCERWQWLHLVELWDYLAPQPNPLSLNPSPLAGEGLG